MLLPLLAPTSGPEHMLTQLESKSACMMKEIWSKPQTIVHAFQPESEKFDFGKNGCHWKGHLKGSRMELFTTKSFVAPPSRELHV